MSIGNLIYFVTFLFFFLIKFCFLFNVKLNWNRNRSFFFRLNVMTYEIFLLIRCKFDFFTEFLVCIKEKHLSIQDTSVKTKSEIKLYNHIVLTNIKNRNFHRIVFFYYIDNWWIKNFYINIYFSCVFAAKMLNGHESLTKCVE